MCNPDCSELTSTTKVLTPGNSLQGGFPVSISMMVHPKLHISTAMATLGLDSFFMAAIMSFNQQIAVRKEHVITQYPSQTLKVIGVRKYLWSHPVGTSLQRKFI